MSTHNHVNIKVLLTILVFCLMNCSGCVSRIPLLSNAGYVIDNSTNHVSSWKELNEQNLVMQRYDFSCGAASLATLMKYYFNQDITEKNILDNIEIMFTSYEYSRIEQDGLSFLELEKISRFMGYQSVSVRLKLPALLELSGPVIVFLNTKYYRHFAVLRGIKEDRVFLADPSRGNIHLSINRFLSEWKGEIFVLGKEGFGLPDNYTLAILHSPGFRNELKLLRQPLFEHLKITPLRLQ